MSSNFERLHEIINEPYAENFSSLSHWEPKKRQIWASISENPVPLFDIDIRIYVENTVSHTIFDSLAHARSQL